MFILVADDVLKLVQEFGVYKFNLVIVYIQNGVFKVINNLFVLFLSFKLQTHFIHIVVAHYFLQVNDEQEDKSSWDQLEKQSKVMILGIGNSILHSDDAT